MLVALVPAKVLDRLLLHIAQLHTNMIASGVLHSTCRDKFCKEALDYAGEECCNHALKTLIRTTWQRAGAIIF